MVSRPSPLASRIGISRKAGIGKNVSTPTRLNRKWAMAMLMAVFELTIAARNALMVVPMLAPRINGTALRSLTNRLATRGTTNEVVTELLRIAAVVSTPQAKDLSGL